MCLNHVEDQERLKIQHWVAGVVGCHQVGAVKFEFSRVTATGKKLPLNLLVRVRRAL